MSIAGKLRERELAAVLPLSLSLSLSLACQPFVSMFGLEEENEGIWLAG